jgi:Uma2 family endonuclease
MTTLATQRMTAEEFFEWANRSENRDRHFELVQGELVELPRHGLRHGVICANAGWILGNFTFQQRKGYVCSNNTGLIMERDPDTVRGPDLMLFDDVHRYEELNPKFAEQLPKLAVEVLSPDDRWGKVMRRIAHFLSCGTPLVWLVDPEDRSVMVFRPGQLPQVFDENEELTGYDILPDLRCRVADFFFVPGEESPPASAS